MQGKHWVPPVVLIIIAIVAVWSTQRLIHGKPRWNSMAAVGNQAQPPAEAALPAGAAHDACCAEEGPAGKETAGESGAPANTAAAVCPAGAGEGASATPHTHTDDPHAAHGTALPPGHPPIDGMEAGGAPATVAAAKDPVCGMSIHPDADTATAKHQGQTFYFCNPKCRDAFMKSPARYL